MAAGDNNEEIQASGCDSSSSSITSTNKRRGRPRTFGPSGTRSHHYQHPDHQQDQEEKMKKEEAPRRPATSFNPSFVVLALPAQRPPLAILPPPPTPTTRSSSSPATPLVSSSSILSPFTAHHPTKTRSSSRTPTIINRRHKQQHPTIHSATVTDGVGSLRPPPISPPLSPAISKTPPSPTYQFPLLSTPTTISSRHHHHPVVSSPPPPPPVGSSASASASGGGGGGGFHPTPVPPPLYPLSPSLPPTTVQLTPPIINKHPAPTTMSYSPPTAPPPPPPALGSHHQVKRGTDQSKVIITIKPGEDICLNIKSYARSCGKPIWLRKAKGQASKIVLRGNGGHGTVTYEGRFGIESLQGTLVHEPGNGSDPKGDMSILFSGLTRTYAGMITGDVIASSRVEVTVSNFTSGP